MKRYLLVKDAAGQACYQLEECPACNGSGKVDPNAVLGGKDAGGGVCPVCHGEKEVRVKVEGTPMLNDNDELTIMERMPK